MPWLHEHSIISIDDRGSGLRLTSSTRQIHICVLTYHRPGPLTVLLPLLVDEVAMHEESATSDRVQILVIDNDPQGSARGVVGREMASNPDVTIRYIVEPRPGIAAARNRALDESAAADLLAFIDDDETPEPGWLSALVSTRDDFDAAGVSGPVVSVFATAPEGWITQGGYFDRAYAQARKDGAVISRAATNNLLLDLATVRASGIRFDDAFGLTGGEDSLFTEQLSRSGGTLRWSRHARVYDHVPPERLTRSYALERSFHLSNCATRVDLFLADTASARASVRLMAGAQSLAKFVVGTCRAALGTTLGSVRLSSRGQRALAQSRGTVAALLGRYVSPYGQGGAHLVSNPAERAPRVMVAHPSSDLYGADLQLVETVRGLVETGHVVVVNIPGDGPLACLLKAAGAQVRFLEVPVLRKAALTPSRLPRLLWSMLVSFRRLRALLRSERPGALVVNTVTIPSWLVAARLAGTPALCHVHEAEAAIPLVVRLGLTAPLLLAKRVITNSQASTDTITSTIPWLAGRVRLVYNGISGPSDPAPLTPATRPGVRLVLVGRLSPRKGTDVALEALALIRAAGHDASLVLCGSTFPGYEWFEKALRERAGRDDLAGHVTFRGYVASPVEELAASDFVVVPSRVEPFGNVAVEAMLACRPLVASATQGLKEIVDDHVNGLLVEPDDPRALADAVLSLIRDPDLAVQLAARARTDAVARFSVERYRNELVHYVDDLIGAP